MDQGKVEAILSWPTPKTRRDVQSFLGFCNFYRRFIRNFSHEVRPLTTLTKKDLKFLWTEAAQVAFLKLKDRFTTAPILALPEPGVPFVVEVDASDIAAGAILSQRQGPKESLHPVAFFSKVFSPAEKNYDVSDRELLAVKLALEEWRHLLEGALHPVTIITDHKNLEYLQRAKRLKSRQARWSIFFTRFNLHFTYRPGSKNGKADALSRLPQEPVELPEKPEPILPPKFFLATYPNLWEQIKKGTESLSPSETLPSMSKEQGLLMHQGRVVVPRSAIPLVLQLGHDAPLAGHGGTHKTKSLIQRHFWWKKMAADIHEYVTTCPTCVRSKDVRTHAQGLLQPLSVPSRAWAELAMDFIVELPSSRGCDTILVVVDRLTKMAHFISLQGLPSAKETAEALIREVVRLHGIPEAITTDRGTQFTSRFWEALCKSLNIRRCLSTAFHPRTNGQTERTNQTLEQYLRCYIAQTQDEWHRYLPLAEFAFNNQVHRSTGVSPFYANYGFHPVVFPGSPIPCATPGVEELVRGIAENLRVLRKTLARAQEDYKKYFDLKHSPAPQYRVGDKVWLSTAHIRLALPSRKLGPRSIGPFTVVKIISPTAVKLQLPVGYKIHPVFHVSLLRPVVPDPFPHRSLRSAPGPVMVEGEEEYEVETIVDSRLHRGSLQYLVGWKGYGPEENSWVAASEVHASAKVQAFHRAHPSRPSPRSVRPRRGRPRRAVSVSPGPVLSRGGRVRRPAPSRVGPRGGQFHGFPPGPLVHVSPRGGRSRSLIPDPPARVVPNRRRPSRYTPGPPVHAPKRGRPCSAAPGSTSPGVPKRGRPGGAVPGPPNRVVPKRGRPGNSMPGSLAPTGPKKGRPWFMSPGSSALVGPRRGRPRKRPHSPAHGGPPGARSWDPVPGSLDHRGPKRARPRRPGSDLPTSGSPQRGRPRTRSRVPPLPGAGSPGARNPGVSSPSSDSNGSPMTVDLGSPAPGASAPAGSGRGRPRRQ